MYRKSNHYVVYQELLITINITITKNNIITINNNSTIVLKVNYTSKMKKQAQEKRSNSWLPEMRGEHHVGGGSR